MKEMEIYQYLDSIVGQPVCKMGRASNMLWIGLGETITVKSVNGKWIEKSTYALHIQTMWRIVNEEEKNILLASSDIYSPKNDMDPALEFDWEPQGNNLFDEKSKEWISRNKMIYVTEYKINRCGDLLLIFSNNERLEVFVDASDDTECWRLFKVGCEEPHLVVRGSGIDFE